MSKNLADYDFVVLIDKSGSMETQDCPGGKSRWQYAKEYAESIAMKAGQFDTNGIDVVLFAGAAKLFEGVTADKVTQIFTENSPGGSTNTADALKLVLDSYNKRKAAGTAKPIIVICVTDGVPDDQKALEEVIKSHTLTMEKDEETGITFVQIGKDAGARDFLKRLDDGLQASGAKFDIVDTKNSDEMENVSITEILEMSIAD